MADECDLTTIRNIITITTERSIDFSIDSGSTLLHVCSAFLSVQLTLALASATDSDLISIALDNTGTLPFC